MPASYYDLASYDPEDERENEPQGPPLVNLFAAASYVGQLLQSNDLQYAVQGGFAMVCRGSHRTTTDVDMSTNASMKQLWQIMEPSPDQVLPRLIIPNSKLVDKVVRVFVRTGPSHGDSYCHEDRDVELDLNIFGAKNGDCCLVDHIETVEVDFEGQTFHINVLDVFYMMRTKLRTCTSRAAARDYDDLEFLLRTYSDQVQDIASRLDLEDRASFIETDMVQSKGPIFVRRYMGILGL